uniref:Transposase Tc1-like domain-containing protein n=1 Tax=Seriola lalandi dorsalis TaxID=1841481 RepID=A0A3B4WY32_SERLL
MLNLSDFEIGFIVGARVAGASVTKSAQLTSVSTSVTEVTSACRSVGEASINRVGQRGQQRTFDGRDAHALARYVRKNRRAALPRVIENVSAGRDQTVEGYYSKVAVHKPLIIKMNAHLRVQWCKNQSHSGQMCSTALFTAIIKSHTREYLLEEETWRVNHKEH